MLFLFWRVEEGGRGRRYLLPVLSTLRLPNCLFAVTSQAIRELARPRIGERVAAMVFCLDHISVRVAGRTAEEMMTPIIRYKYPIEMPISVCGKGGFSRWIFMV